MTRLAELLIAYYTFFFFFLQRDLPLEFLGIKTEMHHPSKKGFISTSLSAPPPWVPSYFVHTSDSATKADKHDKAIISYGLQVHGSGGPSLTVSERGDIWPALHDIAMATSTATGPAF